MLVNFKLRFKRTIIMNKSKRHTPIFGARKQRTRSISSLIFSREKSSRFQDIFNGKGCM
jgi:hypothetical protein